MKATRFKSMAFLFFTLTHKMRIEAYARIVDQDAAVDLADIHPGNLASVLLPHESGTGKA